MKPQPTNRPEMREPAKTQQILLYSRPSGEPSQDNFQLTGTEVPKPGPGQMPLRKIYLSLDPYMRGRMNAGPSYAPPVEIGKVMGGQSICEVVESNVPNYYPRVGWRRMGMLVLQAGLCLLSRGVGGNANFYQPLRSIKLGPKYDFVRSDIQDTNLFGTVLLVF